MMKMMKKERKKEGKKEREKTAPNVNNLFSWIEKLFLFFFIFRGPKFGALYEDNGKTELFFANVSHGSHPCTAK